MKRQILELLHVLGARLISAGLQAMLLIFVARDSNPSEIGHLFAVLAVGGVILSVSDLGLQTRAAKLHSVETTRTEGTRLFSAHRYATTTVAGLLWIGSLIYVLLQAADAWLLLIPIHVLLEKEIQGASAMAIARGETAVQFGALVLARATAVLAFALIRRVIPESPPGAYLASAILGSMLAILWVSSRAPRAPSAGALGCALSHLRNSLPYAVATLSGQIRLADVTVVAWVGSAQAAGIYALPARMMNPLRMAATALASVAFPHAARNDRAALRKLDRVMLVGLFALLVILLPAFIWTQPLLALIVGVDFERSAEPLRWVMLASLLSVPGSYMSGVLQGAGHHYAVAHLGVYLAVASIAGAALGAALAGATGAAIAAAGVAAIQLVSVGTMRQAWLGG